MNILVTGGLGFIGHRVVKCLQDHSVSVIDNRTTYGVVPAEEIAYLIQERQQHMPPVSCFFASIENTDTVDYLVKRCRPEVIVHLASFPRQKVVNQQPAAGADAMVRGMVNLLESAVRYQVRRFVYVSSSMVYGDFIDGVTEDTLCRPQGQYGIMKLCGEWLLQDYARRTGMESVILRPSAVYGPRDVEDRVVSKFLLSAMRGDTVHVRGPDQLLDFTYVDDAADGIARAALSASAAGKIYNITRGRARTLLEAAQLAISVAGRGRIELYCADPTFPQRNTLNINRAQEDLEFSPVTDIEQGFQLYHAWIVNSLYWSQKTV
jgi:nucleoside-diphosphate-sugar epimerase